MRRIILRAFCPLAVAASALWASPSFGDVLLWEGNTWKAHRFTDAGDLRQSYDPGSIPIEDFIGYAVDSASEYVYAHSFSIGFGEVWPMSADTGDLAGFFEVHGNFVQTGGVDLPRIVQPRTYRFHVNSMTGGEEVFVSAYTGGHDLGGGTGAARIERFSAIDGSLIQSIFLPNPNSLVSDIAFGADDRMFAATDDGVIAFTKQAGGMAGLYGSPGSPGTLLVPGNIYGTIAIGADGAILYRSSLSGTNINRFDPTTGALLGELIGPADLAGDLLVAFEVDSNGALFLVHGRGDPSFRTYFLSKFNSVTGDLISTVTLDKVHSPGNFLAGELYILPVPEPATATVAAVLTMGGAGWARRQNRAFC